MTIQLPADLEASIRQKVASGHFADVAEVIREAMRLLDEQERQLTALRAKLRVGLDELDRGEGAEWTPALRQQLRQEADEMFRRGEEPDPDVCP
jgi:putative addiction module CopG family antidote